MIAMAEAVRIDYLGMDQSTPKPTAQANAVVAWTDVATFEITPGGVLLLDTAGMTADEIDQRLAVPLIRA